MKRRVILTAAVLSAALGGCAMSPIRANELAQGAQEWELCYVAVTGKGQQALRNAVAAELDRRRTDCRQHMQMVMARLQADGIKRADDQAQIEMGLRLMQAGRPQPTPATNCTSVVSGRFIDTTCR